MKPINTLATLLLLALSILVFAQRNGADFLGWETFELTRFNPEQGHAYLSPLGQPWMSSHDGHSIAQLLEDGIPLGPGNCQHQDIRDHGRGRLSFWHSQLYFSTSDNTDPRNNNRTYEVHWPRPIHFLIAWLLYAITGVATVGLIRRLGAWYRKGITIPPLIKRLYSLAKKTLLAVLMVLILLAVVEGCLFLKFPFLENTWPSRFDTGMGWTFEPGAIMRQSNFLDFAVEQKVNSFGFLDQEQTLEKEPGTFRILLLGDSFVEAVQVAIEDKLQVLLETHLNQALPDRRFEVAAMGFSGCGTSNELSFYENLGRQWQPDLVLLLFVTNDFSNNSPLLEAVRNGWHPEHSSRLFYTCEGETFRRIDIDPQWQDYLLPITSPPVAPTPGQKYFAWSRLYTWISRFLNTRSGSAGQAATDLYCQRIAHLRETPTFAEALRGWDYPDDLALDQMFWAREMPPAFDRALAITEHVLSLFKKQTQADGARLLLLATPPYSAEDPGNLGSKRQLLKFGLRDRLRAMADNHDLPLLELREPFSKRGALHDAHFTYDHHWNENGHAWAAEALLEYLTKERPDLLRSEDFLDG